MSSPPSLGILGGTGAQGQALARRWAAAGYPVLLGSREAARATATAAMIGDELASRPGAVRPVGGDNASAAAADIVVVSVPYAALVDTVRALADLVAGKTVVSVVVPLVPPRVSVVQLPAAGSAAAELAALLPGARVVAAFQNVAAGKLAQLGADVACDVLVCGDDREAKAAVLDLAAAIGLTAYDAGPLANAGVVEGFSALLIGLNRRYKSTAAGLRITNLPRPTT
jgi:hypothetical protein